MNKNKSRVLVERFFHRLENSINIRGLDNHPSRNVEQTPIIKWVSADIDAELPRFIAEVESIFKEEPDTLMVNNAALDLHLIDKDGTPFRPQSYIVTSSKGQVRALIITRPQGEACHVCRSLYP